MEQPLSIKMENSIDDLLFTVNMFKEVFNGNLTDIDNENSKEVKLGWSKKRLNSKLKELRDIKQEYVVNEKRLENEIVTIEKELAELEEKMINEDNERILNELYRRISSAKSKIDSLNIRRSNYSVCFNLLDMIELNISEIIQAGKYTTSELNKAKGMLNMGRLRETAVNPEKALPILKLIQDDVNKIHEKVSSVDEKVFGNVINQTTITSDAMKYKEELLKKRREKEILNINNNELGLEQNTKPKPTNKGEQ